MPAGAPANQPAPAVFIIKDEDPAPSLLPPKLEPRRRPAARPPADDYDGEEYERPSRRGDVIIVERGGRTDAPGVISLIFGCLSVVCTLLGCCTLGITCWAAVPFALLGGIVGFFGQGNMRVAGLVLNFLALIPATILLVIFVGMAGLAGVGAAVGPPEAERKVTPAPAGPTPAPAGQPTTRPETPPAPAKTEPQWGPPTRRWCGEMSPFGSSGRPSERHS